MLATKDKKGSGRSGEKFIPYRENIFTELLSKYLFNKNKIWAIGALSPSSMNYEVNKFWI